MISFIISPGESPKLDMFQESWAFCLFFVDFFFFLWINMVNRPGRSRMSSDGSSALKTHEASSSCWLTSCWVKRKWMEMLCITNFNDEKNTGISCWHHGVYRLHSVYPKKDRPVLPGWYRWYLLPFPTWYRWLDGIDGIDGIDDQCYIFTSHFRIPSGQISSGLLYWNTWDICSDICLDIQCDLMLDWNS